MGTFQHFIDKVGQFRFQLKAGNGVIHMRVHHKGRCRKGLVSVRADALLDQCSPSDQDLSGKLLRLGKALAKTTK